MKLSLAPFILAAGLLASAGAFAQTPSTAPAGSTGVCKDGSYSSNATKKGACAGHKGVKDWYGESPAKSAVPVAATAPAPAAMPAKTAPPVAKSATAMPSAAPTAGGGPGQVWVNSSSKVYHCSGTKWYGKTKQGEYMTEAAAKAAGNHADHAKACS